AMKVPRASVPLEAAARAYVAPRVCSNTHVPGGPRERMIVFACSACIERLHRPLPGGRSQSTRTPRMKMFVKSFMAGLLVLASVEAADATNRYFLCSYEVFEDGRPVVRRIEYYEPDLQAAMRQFDMFLRQ